MAKGKGKAKFKKLMDKVKAAPGKVLQSAEEVPFVALLPFKEVMKKALDAKGVTHTNFLHDIAPKFAKTLAKGHFADFAADHDGQGYNLGEDVAAGIISSIINYFKTLHAKKASGQPMTQGEEQVLSEADKVADGIAAGTVPPHMMGMGLENAPGNAVIGFDIKSMILTPKGLLATVAIIFGIWGIYKLVSK